VPVTVEEQFRSAILAGDHAGAAALLRHMPPLAPTIEEASRLHELLAWALKITHAARTGYSRKLAGILRSSAYRQPRSGAVSTFSMRG
jgi:hypothetical protein